MNRTRVISLFLSIPVLVMTPKLLAQTPVDNLQDLVGARGRDGEAQLQQRGYEFVGAEQSGDSSYTYWTQRRTGRCITVRTADGRYASLVSAPSADCDRVSQGQNGQERPQSSSNTADLRRSCNAALRHTVHHDHPLELAVRVEEDTLETHDISNREVGLHGDGAFQGPQGRWHQFTFTCVYNTRLGGVDRVTYDVWDTRR